MNDNQPFSKPLPQLQVSHLSHTYGRKKAPVFTDLSFEAQGGTCVGILGKNGCGKSSLLSILAGIKKPTSGTISLSYQNESSQSTPVVGYVPQENPLMEELTALDNLRLWYSDSPLSLEQELAQGTLAMLDIPSFLHTRVKHMSGGMKKRLNIGCAIACDPQILLLDEPGAALDLPCKLQILDYLAQYKQQGNLILIATHEEQEIAFCDQIYLLDQGTLTPVSYNGDPHALFT